MLHGCLHLIIVLPLKIFLSAEIGESCFLKYSLSPGQADQQ
jgi:hypothetical protein